MPSLRTLSLSLASALLLLPPVPSVHAQQFSDGQIDIVSARLAEAALESWELGTRSQTILELNATTYSVYSSKTLPPPSSIPSDLTTPLQPFFEISKTIVTNRTKSNNNTVGPQPLIQDGSAADPASNGMAVLLANWTGQDGGQVDYAGAALDQLNFLLTKVPRTSDGAISHRVSEVQLWSDFVYMVPPFLAYYGVLTSNRTLLEESYNQIKLYRNYLRDGTAGMWRHVLLGSSGNDNGFWSTGNGWAAAGMLRVFCTIRASEFANSMMSEQTNLTWWVQEIHDGMYKNLDNTTDVFSNYADQPSTAPGNFPDAASTALLASTVYRLAVISNVYHHLPSAERSRKALTASSSNATSDSFQSSGSDSFAHFTSEGWLTPVVNPHSYGVQGNQSAEAQAFVVQMHSAWRDWQAAGGKGANAGLVLSPGWMWMWGVGLGVLGAVVL